MHRMQRTIITSPGAADASSREKISLFDGQILEGAQPEVARVSADIIKLDRKITNAVQAQRGINLSPADLDVLTLIGVLELLGAARNIVIKENAQWRSRAASTPEADITSTTSGGKGASLQAPSYTSAGTKKRQVGSDERAQARAMFG
ncbi:hypothetical protein M527_24495 [Sphingobium indicum IP26]|nr:hypothetical protein M527_24635 [Sphingobium indicum IP26]EPR15488.1 hypothetical protein M527_24495 [Sphingobium indicum IP26]